MPAKPAFNARRRALFVLLSLVLMNHLQVCARPASVRHALPCAIRFATRVG